MIGVVNRARAVLTALLVVSALSLAGCSGDEPEPRFAPPSSEAPGSPSTTATSGPAEPQLPEAAKGTDAAAAEAFVKHYWSMVNYAQATGDVDGLRALGLRCVTCDRGIDSIVEVYEAGGSIRGGVGTVLDPTGVLVGRTGKRVVVDFTLQNTKQVVDYPGDQRDEVYPSGSLDYRLLVQRSPSEWRARFLGQQ